MPLTIRIASEADRDAIGAVMTHAIALLQRSYLSPAQIVASAAVMGLDTQLLRDGTYFVVEDAGVAVGCGGWSRRATLYGGDAGAVPREPRLLDPPRDAARIRAMYTHPAHVRRGIGRLVLRTAEQAARADGFDRAELMATLAGEALYVACGYVPLERTAAVVDGETVPLIRMTKPLG